MTDWKVHEFSKEIELFQREKIAVRWTKLQLKYFYNDDEENVISKIFEWSLRKMHATST